MNNQYLQMVMQQISNILYNGSQSSSKDEILDGLVNIIKQYNSCVNIEDKIDVCDFRNNK